MSRYTTEGGCRPRSTSASRRSAIGVRQRRRRPIPPSCATSSPATTVHRRRLERLRAADVPRQPRHGPDRALPRRHGATGDRAAAARRLAHALMYLTRGQPVVYYGDEQGFTGDGGDKDARQDMFASQVALVQRRRPDRHRRHDGGRNFDTSHPLYQLHRGPRRAAGGASGAGRRRPDPPLRRPTARASSRSAGSTPTEHVDTSSR